VLLVEFVGLEEVSRKIESCEVMHPAK
jgi:hypothetical protein